VADLTAAGETWRALALLGDETRPQLAVLRPDGASKHPSAILGFLRAEELASHGRAPPHTPIQAALRAAERWLAHQRGAAAVAPVLGSPSPAHAAVLRRLDGVLARAGRHQRQSVAALAARCRDLVLRSRGAGAEDFLHHWLEANPISANPASLATLAESLEGRDPGRRAAALPARLVALYILAPAEWAPAAQACEPLPRASGHRYIVAGPTIPAPSEPARGTTPVHAA
jgi:hypothetical protein